jgi:hypothetical protein
LISFPKGLAKKRDRSENRSRLGPDGKYIFLFGMTVCKSMRPFQSLLAATVVLIAAVVLFAQNIDSAKRKNDVSYNAQSKSIVVPAGDGHKIVTDGTFSEGEWDKALMFPISPNYEIWLMASSDNLFIGLRSKKPVRKLVSDFWIVSDEKAITQLHSSEALAQGVCSFPFNENNGKHFSLQNTGWSANFLIPDKTREREWIEAGRPRGEKYSLIYPPNDGKEYIISRSQINGNRLKLRIRFYDSEREFSYPNDSNTNNADNWVELILPINIAKSQ